MRTGLLLVVLLVAGPASAQIRNPLDEPHPGQDDSIQDVVSLVRPTDTTVFECRPNCSALWAWEWGGMLGLHLHSEIDNHTLGCLVGGPPQLVSCTGHWHTNTTLTSHLFIVKDLARSYIVWRSHGSEGQASSQDVPARPSVLPAPWPS